MLDAGDVADVPLAFIARTVYVCAVFASCPTETEVAAVELVLPSEAAQT